MVSVGVEVDGALAMVLGSSGVAVLVVEISLSPLVESGALGAGAMGAGPLCAGALGAFGAMGGWVLMLASSSPPH